MTKIDDFFRQVESDLDKRILESPKCKDFDRKCQHMPTTVGSKFCLGCCWNSTFSHRIRKLICNVE